MCKFLWRNIKPQDTPHEETLLVIVDGSGVFMFKFLLVLKDLEMLSGGNPVYWLLEATANMKAEYRHVLNSFLEVSRSATVCH